MLNKTITVIQTIKNIKHRIITITSKVNQTTIVLSQLTY